MRAAAYTAWLVLTFSGIIAVDTMLLPVTTAWAASHGLTGWALWATWAIGSLAALHHAVLLRTRVGGYAVHAATVAAVFMAIAAPVRWTETLLATAGAAIGWLMANIAPRRPWD